MATNLKEQLARNISTLEVPAVETITDMEAAIMAKDSDVIQLRPQTETLPAVIDTTPSFATTLIEARNQVILFQQFVSEFMKAGVDFGIVPGTDKPTLLKPGAEKLCEIYGFSKYVEIITQVENWELPLFAYIVKVRLVNKRTGFTEAEGVGAANSREKKYIKLDAFSLQNTLLKMAKKRALVDAVLSATRSSGMFTQDIEDIELPQQVPALRPTTPVDIQQHFSTSSMAMPEPANAAKPATESIDVKSAPTNCSPLPPSDILSGAPLSIMSKSQATFITSLIGKHRLSTDAVEDMLERQFGHTNDSFLSKTEASQFIGVLLSIK